MSEFVEAVLADLVAASRPITYGIVQPGPDVSPEGVPLIRGKDYSSGKIDTSNLYHVLPEIDRPYSRSKVRQGDLLFSIVGYVGQASVVPPELDQANITQTTARISIDPSKADNIFVYYHLSAPHFRPEISKYEKGSAQPGLNLSDVQRLKIKLPSLAMQRRIAEILSTLDEAIGQTERLTTKYQQIKAGLMHDLFTRGVLPNGRLRPKQSDAPSLYQRCEIGWIPSDWRADYLGGNAEIVSGVTLGSKAVTVTGITVPYLRVANVQDGYLDLSEVKTITISQEQFNKLRLLKGDVLMNEGGDFDKLGRGTVWNDEVESCVHQNHVFRVRPMAELDPRYLAFWSQSEFGKQYFLRSSKQSTNLASINSTQLHKFPIALPPIQEQDGIACRVEAVCNRIINLNDEKNVGSPGTELEFAL